jgi:hypothetical protein
MPAEILSTIGSAITTVKKLAEISDKIKNAELRNLIGDLSLKLADLKMELSEVTNENTELKKKIRSLESTEFDPCPKCRARAWQLQGSVPHPDFGTAVSVRTYKCSACGFSEKQEFTRL